MAVNLTRFSANVNNIQGLSDRPNTIDGLTSAELKAKFDKAGSDIKEYLNGTHIPELESKLNQFNNMFENQKNMFFPIGKIEIFFDNEDHSDYLGFSWEKTLIGKVPIGIDRNDEDFNQIGKTGGEKEHTLTIEEIPPHSHLAYQLNYVGQNVWGIPAYRPSNTDINQNKYSSTSDSGGGKPHNNMSPYEVVAFWKRVS